MKPIIVTESLAAPGLRVVRGRDWKWENQDGGAGGVGTIDQGESNEGWIKVKWDKGSTYYYRIGGEGKYDLYVHVPTGSVADKAQNPTAEKKLKELRDTLSMYDTREYEMEITFKEKSKTNTDGTNNTDAPRAIKVRRPISTIQGSKRRIYSPITGRRS